MTSSKNSPFIFNCFFSKLFSYTFFLCIPAENKANLKKLFNLNNSLKRNPTVETYTENNFCIIFSSKNSFNANSKKKKTVYICRIPTYKTIKQLKYHKFIGMFSLFPYV